MPEYLHVVIGGIMLFTAAAVRGGGWHARGVGGRILRGCSITLITASE